MPEDSDEAAVRLNAGDVEGASELFDRAHAGAGALGMAAITARVESLRAAAGETVGEQLFANFALIV